MRVVLDVNVLVSATIIRVGKSHQIVARAAALEYDWLTCEHILFKTAEVLARPHIQKKYHRWVTPAQQKEFFDLVRAVAHMVEIKSQVDVIGDQEDDIVLACAKDGQADYLVTGDPHLIKVGEFQGTKVVTPDQFLGVLPALA